MPQFKKKYIVIKPSPKIVLPAQYNTFSQLSQQLSRKNRGSHSRANKNMENVRLNTDWPTLEMQPVLHQYRLSTDKNKHQRSLKKAPLSKATLIGKFYLPSNKQNHKKNTFFRQLASNKYRATECTEIFSKPKLQSALSKNRNSENKILMRHSIQKNNNSINKYRLCSPHQDQFRQFEETVQSKTFCVQNALRKDSPHNVTTLDTSQEEEELREGDFRIQDLIGSGTFGKVFRARLTSNNKLIALKRVPQDKKYKTRQLQIIRELNSPFLVKIFGSFISQQEGNEYLNIAMESYHHNFYERLHLSPALSSLQIKCYVYQMLRGLLYLHRKGICHRDLKPQNMLVKNNKLVICDFGSAKILTSGEQNISYICSRCYRAPELIFEATDYSTQIDMWSLGCILLEILNNRPLFIADSSLNHMLQIIKVLGTPTQEDVRSMNPHYELDQYDLPKIKPQSFKKLFPRSDPQLIDLIQKIIRYAPQKRLTAQQALCHPYFDQIREQSTYRSLPVFKGLQDFFNFQRELLGPWALKRLVPEWCSK